MAVPQFQFAQWGQSVGNSLGDALVERGHRNALADLVPRASAGDAEAQNRLLALDPRVASYVNDMNRQRKTDELAAAESERSRRLEGLKWGAGAIINATSPEQKASIYETQVLPHLSALGFQGLPEKYDPSVDATASSIIGRFPEAAKPVSLSKGSVLVDPATGKEIARGPEDIGENYRTVGRSLIDLRNPGRPLYTDPTSNTGFAVTLPDGTQVQYGDITGSKKNYDESIGRMVGAENALTRLDEIEELYNPDLLRVPARVENLFATGKDYLGADLSPQEAEQLDQATQMKAALIDNLSQYVKEISGAAATDAERRTLSGAQPYANDSPAVLKAKLKRARKASEMIVARERQRTGQAAPQPQGSGGWSITPVN